MTYKEMIPLVTGDHEFVRQFRAHCLDRHHKEEALIADLRKMGVKACHPDDGWIDRKENTIHFAYPRFDDGVEIGSIVAIGGHEKFRLVELTAMRVGITGLVRWEFKPTIL